MKFSIKRPNKLSMFDKEDTTVSEAISTIYRQDDDWMLTINWFDHELFLDGSMIGDIYNDIVKMLRAIEANESGFTIFFLDSGFTVAWNIEVENEELMIDASWTSVVSEDSQILEKLRKLPTLRIQKSEFFASWSRLLSIIKEDLSASGYSNRLKGFEYLDSLN
jgi:hypothetical protein